MSCRVAGCAPRRAQEPQAGLGLCLACADGGRVLIQVAGQVGLGGRTENAPTEGYFAVVAALVIVIISAGIVVNTGFNRIDLAVRRRYGLIDASGR